MEGMLTPACPTIKTLITGGFPRKDHTVETCGLVEGIIPCILLPVEVYGVDLAKNRAVGVGCPGQGI